MEIHTLLEMPPFQDITEEELLSLILAPVSYTHLRAHET